MKNECGNARAQLVEKMTRIFCSCDDLNELLDHMSGLFQNPLHITDATYKLIASSSLENIDDDSWKDTVEFGYLSAPLLRNALKIHIDQLPSDDEKLVYFFCDNPECSPYTELVTYIIHKGSILGYLCMLAVNHIPTEDEIYVMGLFNKLVGKWLSRSNEYDRFRKIAMSEQILIALIENRDYDEEIIKNRIIAAQLDTAKYFCLVNIFKTDDHRQIREMLRSQYTNVRAFYYQCQIVALFTYRTKNEEELTYHIQQLKSMISDKHAHMCVSDGFSDLKEISVHYHQNKRILELANVYYNYKSGIKNAVVLRAFEEQICEYDRLKYYDFVYMNALAYGLDDLLAHVQSGVLALMEYDEKNNTLLFDTLLVFLEQKQSYTRTSELMYTHKNTIIYRIEKIKNISKMDITEGGMLGVVYSSCVFVQMYRILKDSGFPNIEL